MHERGSHAARGSRVEVGAWNAPLLEEDPEVVGVVVLGAPTPVLPAAEIGVTVTGGGFTLNWVPVTTVTRDPEAGAGARWVYPNAEMEVIRCRNVPLR